MFLGSSLPRPGSYGSWTSRRDTQVLTALNGTLPSLIPRPFGQPLFGGRVESGGPQLGASAAVFCWTFVALFPQRLVREVIWATMGAVKSRTNAA